MSPVPLSLRVHPGVGHVLACRSSYVVEPGLDLCLRCGAVLLLIGQRGVAGDVVNVVNVADVDVVSRALLSPFGSCCSMLSVFLSLTVFVRTVLFVLLVNVLSG